MIKHNIDQIKRELSNAGSKAELVAVSKKKPVEMIEDAYNAGERAFGENYVQELEEKVYKLPKDIVWHFIGHLQTNKVAKLAKMIEDGYEVVIQTVDSAKLADKINNSVRERVTVMIEVHTSDEESKSGCPLEALDDLYNHVKELENLELAGFMTVGNPLAPEDSFKAMQALQQRYGGKLSMGMSQDYQLALRYGTDCIRIGTAIFGARDAEAAQ